MSSRTRSRRTPAAGPSVVAATLSISGRVQLAFTDDALVWEPTWVSLDVADSLVALFTIDRGRVYELDQTDGGRATVDILDREGILDPTNPDGTFYGQIEPLVQCRLRSWNPVTEELQPRFRGWVSDWTYDFDPSQQVNRLTLELTDLFEILGAVDMIPGSDFDTPGGHYGLLPPPESAGQIFYDEQNWDDRIRAILTDAQFPDEFAVVFSGNVECPQDRLHRRGDAARRHPRTLDAEFPGFSNGYVDVQGGSRATAGSRSSTLSVSHQVRRRGRGTGTTGRPATAQPSTRISAPSRSSASSGSPGASRRSSTARSRPRTGSPTKTWPARSSST